MTQSKVFFQENLRKDDFVESFLESSGGRAEVLCCIGFDCLIVVKEKQYETLIDVYCPLLIEFRRNRLSHKSSRFRFLIFKLHV